MMIYGNMIVLCPNHHAEFDYSVKFIHRDGTTIIDQTWKRNWRNYQISQDRHTFDIEKHRESISGIVWTQMKSFEDLDIKLGI